MPTMDRRDRIGTRRGLWIACFALLLVSPGAEATYIDPGAGHLLLQALGVAVFGALFYVRQILAVAKRAVTALRRKNPNR